MPRAWTRTSTWPAWHGERPSEFYRAPLSRLVLQDRQKNYPRSWRYRLLQRLFGDNLVVSEGEFWMRERRLAQPAFHRERLEKYAEMMADATNQLLARPSAPVRGKLRQIECS